MGTISIRVPDDLETQAMHLAKKKKASFNAIAEFGKFLEKS